MNKRILISICAVSALAATMAIAAEPVQPKPPAPGQVKSSPIPVPASPSQDQLIYNNTADLLKQVAALTKQVDALSTQVTAITATLKTMSTNANNLVICIDAIDTYWVGKFAGASSPTVSGVPPVQASPCLPPN